MAKPVLLLLLPLTVAAAAQLSLGEDDFQSVPGGDADNPSQAEELLERALSDLNDLALRKQEENPQTRLLGGEDEQEGLGFPAEDVETFDLEEEKREEQELGFPAEDEEIRNFEEDKRGEGLGFPAEDEEIRNFGEDATGEGLGFPAEDEEIRNFGEDATGEELGFPTEERTGEGGELDFPGQTTDEVEKALYRRLVDDTAGEKNDDDDLKPMVKNLAKRGWFRRRRSRSSKRRSSRRRSSRRRSSSRYGGGSSSPFGGGSAPLIQVSGPSEPGCYGGNCGQPCQEQGPAYG